MTCFGVRFGVNEGWSLNFSAPVSESLTDPSAESSDAANGIFGALGLYPPREALDAAAFSEAFLYQPQSVIMALTIWSILAEVFK